MITTTTTTKWSKCDLAGVRWLVLWYSTAPWCLLFWVQQHKNKNNNQIESSEAYLYDGSIYIRRMYYACMVMMVLFSFLLPFFAVYSLVLLVFVVHLVYCVYVYCVGYWYCIDSQHLSIFIGYYLARQQYCVASIHSAV